MDTNVVVSIQIPHIVTYIDLEPNIGFYRHEIIKNGLVFDPNFQVRKQSYTIVKDIKIQISLHPREILSTLVHIVHVDRSFIVHIVKKKYQGGERE